jgi:hypothetical protein
MAAASSYCLKATSGSTGGLDGLGATALDSGDAPGASEPPQPAPPATTATPTIAVHVPQKIRRIAIDPHMLPDSKAPCHRRTVHSEPSDPTIAACECAASRLPNNANSP